MTHKQPRIMIFESDALQRLSIEKMLNGLGYYAVTGMSSATEVFSVLNYASEVFDLIIVNGTLAADADLDFNLICRHHPFIRHALIYDCPTPVFTPSLDGAGLATQSSSSRPPDFQSILYLMRELTAGARNVTKTERSATRFKATVQSAFEP